MRPGSGFPSVTDIPIQPVAQLGEQDTGKVDFQTDCRREHPGDAFPVLAAAEFEVRSGSLGRRHVVGDGGCQPPRQVVIAHCRLQIHSFNKSKGRRST